MFRWDSIADFTRVCLWKLMAQYRDIITPLLFHFLISRRISAGCSSGSRLAIERSDFTEINAAHTGDTKMMMQTDIFAFRFRASYYCFL